ncbi:MAG: hypothetical protein U0570_10560 [Phycisphaerales bacterium]
MDPTTPPPRTTWAHRVLGLDQGELVRVLTATLCGFCLFAGYSVLKPLRDAISATQGKEWVAGLTTYTFLTLLAVTALTGLLVSKLSWKAFVLLAQLTWILGAVAFGLLFAREGALNSKELDGCFFVAISVFNLLSLSILWATLSDIFRADQAKRAFPLIGIGLSLGGIAGPLIVNSLVKQLAQHQFIFIAAGLIFVSAACLAWLLRFAPPRARHGTPGGSLSEMVEGVRAVFASRYLLTLCAFMFLYTVTGTLVYMQQVGIINASIAGLEKAAARTASTAITSRIDLYANILAAALQLIVAGRVLRWIGVAATLTITPLTTLSAIGLLALSPTVAMLVIVQVARRGLHYALDKPAREVLYTVVSPAERYKSKGFIDSFVYRFGDLVGVWSEQGFGKLGESSPLAPFASAGILCFLFGGIGMSLGRQFRAKESDATGSR